MERHTEGGEGHLRGVGERLQEGRPAHLATRGQVTFMRPLFVLYGELLMEYTGSHENGVTAHG